MAAQPPQQIELPIVFVDAEQFKFDQANIFVIQHSADGWFLTVGQAAPPLAIGSPEQQREQLERVGYVPVKVVAKLVVTRKRLEELRDLIDNQLKADPT